MAYSVLVSTICPMAYRVLVSDLLSKPGSSRIETGSIPLDISITNASVTSDGAIEAKLQSLSDGLVAGGTVTFDSQLSCNRCLLEWTEAMTVDFSQVYRFEPQDEDTELGIEDRVSIDLEVPIHDEATLALPTVSLCSDDCLGLCPVCGANMNSDPCDGHEPEIDSPFAALQDLFKE